MKVEQIYNLVNEITTEILGQGQLLNEDLSNVIDVGEQIFSATSIDNYVKSLINHIGRVVFVNRVYEGSAPSVLRDSWEYGSILEKITAELPTATENQSWELEDGRSYDPNIFTKPRVSAKFYNSRTTFEIPMSYTEMQVRESFSNAEQLNSFMSMIETAVYKSLTIKTDGLIMSTISTGIADTLADAFPSGTYTGAGNTRAINLLARYNADHPNATIETGAAAITNPDFIRYASYQMKLVSERMRTVSTLFNLGGTDKFTPTSLQHIVLLSEFAAAADVYEQSDTFHDNFTALPTAERVPYWQGSGTGYAFADTSAINVKTPSGNTVNTSGILGVIFDRDAIGVCNYDRRVTTNYNPRAEFVNSWYKQDAGYWVDENENIVVFTATA